jgi:hypothetical protein
MMAMPIVDLLARGRELAERVSVLWREGESLAFVARTRSIAPERYGLNN